MIEEIQKTQLEVAVKFGDFSAMQRLTDNEGASVMLSPSQDSSHLLTLAARRGDLSMFKFLVERGAMLPSEFDESIAAMLKRRQETIGLITAVGRRWRLPTTAIRVVYKYVVGFNWPAAYETRTLEGK